MGQSHAGKTDRMNFPVIRGQEGWGHRERPCFNQDNLRSYRLSGDQAGEAPQCLSCFFPWLPFSLSIHHLPLSGLYRKAQEKNPHKWQQEHYPPPKYCDAVAQQLLSSILQSFLLPPVPCLGLTPELAQASGKPKTFLQTAVNPRPLAPQHRTSASRKLLQIMTVVSQQHRRYNRDGSDCGGLKGVMNKTHCGLPPSTTFFSELVQVAVSPEMSRLTWWLLPLSCCLCCSLLTVQLKPLVLLYLQDSFQDMFISYKYVHHAGLLSV